MTQIVDFAAIKAQHVDLSRLVYVGPPQEGELSTGQSGGTRKGLAVLDKIKGNSLKWNQLVNRLSSFTLGGITATLDDNGKVTLNGTSNSTTSAVIISGLTNLAGHTIIYGSKKELPEGVSWSFDYNVIRRGLSSITLDASFIGNLYISCQSGITLNNVEVYFQIFDLTKMFGSGNEPSTVAEFEKLFPLPYYAYNPGEIINNKAEALESVGFNQWNEEWEVGTINPTTGQKENDSDRIRTKNYIPIFPETNYYFKASWAEGYSLLARFYDAGKNFIGAADYSGNLIYQNQIFKTPANAHYMMFACPSVYGTTYNHDICINISDAAKNGTYEPYWKNTLNLNIPTLTGKLNGEGESVTIVPEGLKSAGSAYDELTKDKVNKRLGAYSFTGDESSNDIVQVDGKWIFKNILTGSASTGSGILCDRGDDAVLVNGTSYPNGISLKLPSSVTTKAEAIAYMAGATTIYELATPEEYLLDEPLKLFYTSDPGGVTRILPENDDEPEMALPVPCDIRYSKTL